MFGCCLHGLSSSAITTERPFGRPSRARDLSGVPAVKTLAPAEPEASGGRCVCCGAGMAMLVEFNGGTVPVGGALVVVP